MKQVRRYVTRILYRTLLTQLIQGLIQDTGRVFKELVEGTTRAAGGACAFEDNKRHVNSRRKVLIGVEVIIADYWRGRYRRWKRVDVPSLSTLYSVTLDVL